MANPAERAITNLRSSVDLEVAELVRVLISQGHGVNVVFNISPEGEVSAPKMTIHYQRKKNTSSTRLP